MNANPTPCVESDVRIFLESLAAHGGPPIYQLSPNDARRVLAEAQSPNVKQPTADIAQRTIPGKQGDIALTIVRPAGNHDVLPVVLYIHGGGWVLGDLHTHERLVRELADGIPAAVVFVEYSRSPEARFPVAIEECYATAKWIAENGGQINVDARRMAIAGDSVGGNMATAVTMLAKLRGGPAIRLQCLFYPVTDADFDTGSYRQFAEGYFLTRPAMKWFWNSYLPDEASRAQSLASPLRATLEELRGLPTALVITGECDVLRDEGEAYACRLSKAGVRVTATRYLGTIHDFMMLNAITETAAARGAVAQAIDTLRRALAV